MRTRDRKGVAFSCGKSFYHLHPGLPLFDDEGRRLNYQTAAPSVSTSRRNGIAATSSETNPVLRGFIELNTLPLNTYFSK